MVNPMASQAADQNPSDATTIASGLNGALGATLNLLAELCVTGGHRFVMDDARRALEEAPTSDPVEVLAHVAPVLGLRVAWRRMSVSEATWMADSTVPIIAWSASRQCWFVLRRHGALSACVWRSDSPEAGAVTMRQGEIARALGQSGQNELEQFGIVTMPLPDAAMHAHGDAADGGHGGDAAPTPVRRLLALMRPESPELWSIGIFSGITGLLYLALPLAVNAFVSNLSFGARSGPFVQALLAIALVLFVCLAVAGALRAIQHVAAEVVQRRIFVRLASDLSHRLPNVDLASLEGVHAPELVNRFLEVVTVQKSAALLLLTGINLVLSAAIGLAVLAFYHPFLLGFAVVLLLALAAIVFVCGRGALPTSVRESMRKYQLVEWLEEIARHPLLFKGPGGAAFAMARADDLVRGYLDARREHFRILMRQIVGLLALEVAASTALLGVGGWLVLNQQLTLGQLVAAEIIVSAIVAAIAKLGKQFEAWYDAVAAVDKLGYLIDLRLERGGGASVERAGGMRVRAQGLAYRRAGQQSGFANVNVDIAAGERVALLGSRGSGSSTLLEVLIGLRVPTDGTVIVDDLDLPNWDLVRLRSQAMLLREGGVVMGSIADNLRLGVAGVSSHQMQAALDQTGLGEVVRGMPDGLQSRLLTGGLPLTGRQRIRLLVARALVMQPRLLLVDELLDGLDEATLAALAEVLMHPSRSWTLVVATRDARVVARMARVIEMDVTVKEAAHA
jgi:ABC-type bacteriocin/lantibiotic exporter with double-glycine peptidase domain